MKLVQGVIGRIVTGAALAMSLASSGRSEDKVLNTVSQESPLDSNKETPTPKTSDVKSDVESDVKEEKSNKYPLRLLRDEVDSLYLFDDNKDDVLDEIEVKKYVRVVIDEDEDGRLSYSELKKLETVVDKLVAFARKQPYYLRNIDRTAGNLEREYSMQLDLYNYHKRRQPLEKEFNALSPFDKNKDGFLDRSEVEEFVRTEIDKDKDGKLSYEELIKLWEVDKKLSDLRAKYTFSLNFDKTAKNIGEEYLKQLEIYNDQRDEKIKAKKAKVFGKEVEKK